MVGVELWAEIRRLKHVEGLSQREIHRRTGVHRDTIRNALASSTPPVYGPRPPRPSKLEPFVAVIEELLAEEPTLSGVRIREELEKLGYEGGKTILDGAHPVPSGHPTRPRRSRCRESWRVGWTAAAARVGAARSGAPDGRPEGGREVRWSARRKQEVVLRLLRGESLDALARETGQAAGTISAWREAFLEAGQEGLKSRPRPVEERQLADAQRKIGELALDNDILRGAGRGDGSAPSVAEALTVAERLDAPLARVCRVAGVSRSAACEQRRRRSVSEPTAPIHRRRPGPVGAMPDPALLAAIRREIAESPFVGEGHKKLTARLRLRGVCTQPQARAAADARARPARADAEGPPARPAAARRPHHHRHARRAVGDRPDRGLDAP